MYEKSQIIKMWMDKIVSIMAVPFDSKILPVSIVLKMLKLHKELVIANRLL